MVQEINPQAESEFASPQTSRSTPLESRDEEWRNEFPYPGRG